MSTYGANGLLIGGTSGDEPFECPNCGGHYFGHIVRSIGPPLIFDRVECHDQLNEKCRWKFVYPRERKEAAT